MESADFNQQLFYKLIREQRTTRSDETDTIIIDDMVLSEDECILNGWNTHFQRLSTPDPGIENTEDPSAMECTLIEEILKDPKKRKEIPDITTTTTEQAIQKLAKGKAPDHMGLTAEHFKKGGKTIANYTATLLNAAKNNYNIPEVLKTGLLTPVLKKEKDPKIPGNYRGDKRSQGQRQDGLHNHLRCRKSIRQARP